MAHRKAAAEIYYVLRSRAVKIYALLLIAVSMAAVLISLHPSGNDVEANRDVSLPVAQRSGLDPRKVIPPHAKTPMGFEQALSALGSSAGARRADVPTTKNPLLRINHERLSVEAHDVSLTKLLSDISGKSGIAMFYDGIGGANPFRHVSAPAAG